MYWQLCQVKCIVSIQSMHEIVTVHAKTSLVRTKIEIHILSPAYSYTH